MRAPEAGTGWKELRPWLAIGGGIVLGIVIGSVLFFGLPARAEAPQPEVLATQPPRISVPGLEIGSPAPLFDLLRPEGDSVRLADQLGQVVLLNFWATWCGPCRTEMPLIQEAYDTFKDREFVALGVNFDEPAEAVSAFAEELQVTFPLLLDPGGEVQRQYLIRGYPTTVILDREGRIQVYHIGSLTKSQLDAYLKQVGLVP